MKIIKVCDHAKNTRTSVTLVHLLNYFLEIDTKDISVFSRDVVFS